MLDYKDLNECVNALLRRPKDTNSKEVKRRQRKNMDQVKILENEFAKRQNWSRSFVKWISKHVGLRECQVYKWHWDQMKKYLSQQWK